MAKIYAITGGIGSGKSTVCEIIEKLGYTVFSADKVYKELLKCPTFVEKIYKALAIDSTDFNNFNGKLVAEKVFDNKELLCKLNAVTHPEIMKVMLEKSKAVNGVCFNEVPLLFEKKLENDFDICVSVYCSQALRIKRLIQRGMTPSEISKRDAFQFSATEKAKLADIVLFNEGNLEFLNKQVAFVLSRLK